MSLFWRIYMLIAVTLTVIYPAIVTFGPTFEENLRPIRGEQSVSVIERSDHRVCWSWTFTKLRNVASPDLDASIEINGENAGVAGVYDMQTGRYWGMPKYSVLARQDPYTLDYCVDIPFSVQRSDTIKIKQTAYYPGFLGLWKLSVAFPDVISPGLMQ